MWDHTSESGSRPYYLLSSSPEPLCMGSLGPMLSKALHTPVAPLNPATPTPSQPFYLTPGNRSLLLLSEAGTTGKSLLCTLGITALSLLPLFLQTYCPAPWALLGPASLYCPVVLVLEQGLTIFD